MARGLPRGAEERNTIQRRSTERQAFRPALIARCGMNCGPCRAYVREKNPCPGCRGPDDFKPKTRVLCPIETCEAITGGSGAFCFNCGRFPCPQLDRLDKRYRKKYGMSMIDNLRKIGEFGMRIFLRREEERWTCPDCGEILCVHEARCLSCRRRWRQE
jgi:hypothetical protein